jgi:hypothetical protein
VKHDIPDFLTLNLFKNQKMMPNYSNSFRIKPRKLNLIFNKDNEGLEAYLPHKQIQKRLKNL